MTAIFRLSTNRKTKEIIAREKQNRYSLTFYVGSIHKNPNLIRIHKRAERTTTTTVSLSTAEQQIAHNDLKGRSFTRTQIPSHFASDFGKFSPLYYALAHLARNREWPKGLTLFTISESLPAGQGSKFIRIDRQKECASVNFQLHATSDKRQLMMLKAESFVCCVFAALSLAEAATELFSAVLPKSLGESSK